MSRLNISSRPDKWTHPRGKDARHMTHGPIEPMEINEAIVATLYRPVRLIARVSALAAIAGGLAFAGALVWGVVL